MTTATPEETPAAAKAPKKQLTAKDWAKIDALWAQGDVTYADLVKTYQRNLSTFERHFRKRGIKKGSARDKLNKRVSEEMERSQITEAQITAQRIRDTKEEHYRMAAAISRLAWNEILTAKQAGVAFATGINNLKALDNAMTVLKKAREERYAVLGLDRDDAIDPDQIPELVISELTPAQVEELRARDHTAVEKGAAVQDPESAIDLGEDEEKDDVIEEGSEL